MVVFVRKLEVVHKQVGDRLIPYDLQIACVRKLEVICQMCAHCRIDHSEWQHGELLIQLGRLV